MNKECPPDESYLTMPKDNNEGISIIDISK